MDKKYDVGIFGLWYGNNYGSMITYYALSKVLEEMGKTYAMIKNPLGSNLDVSTLRRSHPLRFANERYIITPLYRLNEMSKLNDMFDSFLLGSDQMWNYNLSRPYKQSYFLDFADDSKIKAAYATSFGRDTNIIPQEERDITRVNLQRFDAISVRDDFSKEILKNDFNITAEQTIDPVFLCNPLKYEDLINETDISIDEPFIFAYILDPNKKIGASIRKIAEATGKKVAVIFDEGKEDKDMLRKQLDISSDNIEYFTEATVQEWLYMFKNADLVITDSFHGSCFSVIFKRNFIALRNNDRGGSRFKNLLGMLGLLNNLVEKPDEIWERFQSSGMDCQTDYDTALKKVDKEKEASLKWLKAALSKKAPALTAKKEQSNALKTEQIKIPPDVKNCRMIAALLRDYGIKHIVISSGTRHMQLVRFFENNSCFITHNAVDERSAGFFALGIAAKINKPVAVCCTSGTAASKN